MSTELELVDEDEKVPYVSMDMAFVVRLGHRES